MFPHRRSNIPKAWTGTNPMLQRASTLAQANGHVAQKTGTPSKPVTVPASTLTDKESHDRLKFLMAASLVGHHPFLSPATACVEADISSGLILRPDDHDR